MKDFDVDKIIASVRSAMGDLDVHEMTSMSGDLRIERGEITVEEAMERLEGPH